MNTELQKGFVITQSQMSFQQHYYCCLQSYWSYSVILVCFVRKVLLCKITWSNQRKKLLEGLVVCWDPEETSCGQEDWVVPFSQ